MRMIWRSSATNAWTFIREYAKKWHDLSDETAQSLGKRLLDYQKKRVDLRSKYFTHMSKEISPMSLRNSLRSRCTWRTSSTWKSPRLCTADQVEGC